LLLAALYFVMISASQPVITIATSAVTSSNTMTPVTSRHTRRSSAPRRTPTLPGPVSSPDRVDTQATLFMFCGAPGNWLGLEKGVA
jgi:hypothetical protein